MARGGDCRGKCPTPGKKGGGLSGRGKCPGNMSGGTVQDPQIPTKPVTLRDGDVRMFVCLFVRLMSVALNNAVLVDVLPSPVIGRAADCCCAVQTKVSHTFTPP